MESTTRRKRVCLTTYFHILVWKLNTECNYQGLEVFKNQDHTAPPPNLSPSEASKDQPTIWSYYTRRGEHYDKDLVEDANNTVDVLLIFVSTDLQSRVPLNSRTGGSILGSSLSFYIPNIPDATA